MAEFISISGQVNIQPSNRVQAEVISSKLGELGITDGYMSTILSLAVSGVFELHVTAECVISESLAFRVLIKELDQIMCNDSSISINSAKDSDPWSTVVELESKPVVIRKQNLYFPKATVIRNPK